MVINLKALKFKDRMKVLRPSRESLSIATSIVRNGGVIIYPTDTVYGIGCDPLNDLAVKRIFDIKGRENIPVPILGDSIESLEKVAEFSNMAYELCSILWPGAITFVLPKKLPLDAVTFGMPTVAVRVPAMQITLDIIKKSGGLLVGTSANKSGLPPACSIAELDKDVAELVDAIIDGGRSRYCKPSTIVSLSDRHLKILRSGAVSIDELRSIIHNAGIDIDIL